MLFSGLRNLFGRLGTTQRSGVRPRLVGRYRINLEALEDRLVPAQVDWVCGTGNWATPSCWSTGQLPGASDDVLIDRPGDITVTNSLGSTTIQSLDNRNNLVLEARSQARGARMIVTAGATNRGRLDLTSADGAFTVNFSVSGGTLTNLGNIRALVGTGVAAGGGRNLVGSLINLGTLNVAQNLALDNTQRTFVNTGGRIIVGADKTFAVKGGRTESTAATTQFGSGTSLEGAGTVDLGGTHTLELPTNFTLSTTAKLTFSGDVLVLGPGRFINPVGSRFQMTQDAFVADVDNLGNFDILGTANEFVGNFTTDSNSTLRVLATQVYGSAAVTFAQGFVNQNRIELRDDGTSDAGVTMAVRNGVLTNPVGKTILTTGGLITSPRTIVGQITNEGTLELQRSLTVQLEQPARQFTNVTGLICFGTIMGGNCRHDGTDLTLDNGISNFGSAANTLDGNRSSRLKLTGTHTINLLAPNFFLAAQGVRIKLFGRVTIDAPQSNLLINQTDLVLTGDTIRARLRNEGRLVGWGAENLVDNTYESSASGQILVEGRSQANCMQDPDDEYLPGDCGDATLTFSQDLSNSGPLRLTSADDVFFAQLVQPVGRTLTNTGTGVITAAEGTGGDRLLHVQLVNNNKVVVEQNTVLTFYYITPGVANHVNAAGSCATGGGCLDASQGSITFFSANTLDNQGEIKVGPNQTVRLEDGSLANFNAGTLTGGIYNLDDGQLYFRGADIVTNIADIILTGPASQICDVNGLACDNTDNGLLNFAVNGRQVDGVGRFSLNNKDFVVPVAIAFTNWGTLFLDTSSSFTIQGSLTNFANNTLTAGTYELAGTLLFPNADVTNNAANLTLIGSRPQPRVRDVNNPDPNADALLGLTRNEAGARFTLLNGYNRDIGVFTNAGTVLIDNATFRATSNYTQESGGLTQLDINGVFSASVGSSMTINQGSRVIGVGTIHCELVENSGEFSPGVGNNIGTLAIEGTYRQVGASSTLRIKVSASGADSLAIREFSAGNGGAAELLAGSITVQELAGAGTGPFQVMTFLRRTGTLNPTSGRYTVTYNATDVSINR